MTPDTLLQLANAVALAGWAALACAPIAPRATDTIAGFAFPALLSLAYASLVLAFWSDAPGGFTSLQDIQAIFTMPEIVLAGWLHYLAFDLLVGAWEVRTARRESIAHFLVLPCLGLTFLSGPAGFLLFLGIRAARRFAARPMEA